MMPRYIYSYFVLLWLLTFSQIGCSKVSYEEIDRLTSPDSTVDAVLVRTNSGATTSFGYKLYIVPVKGKPKEDYELFIADHVKDLRMKWREVKFLEISYKEARIFKFSNFWHSKDVKDFAYVVELRLVPLSDSFALSPRDRWVQGQE